MPLSFQLLLSYTVCVRFSVGLLVIVSRQESKFNAAWDLETRHPGVTGRARSGDMMHCLPSSSMSLVVGLWHWTVPVSPHKIHNTLYKGSRAATLPFHSTWYKEEKLSQKPSLRDIQSLWNDVGCWLCIGSSKTWCLFEHMVAPTRFWALIRLSSSFRIVWSADVPIHVTAFPCALPSPCIGLFDSCPR